MADRIDLLIACIDSDCIYILCRSSATSRSGLANLAKHGLDFADFEAGFAFEATITVPSNSSETRFKLIGVFEDRVVGAAVLASLGTEARSLISLRPASRSERRLYENA